MKKLLLALLLIMSLTIAHADDNVRMDNYDGMVTLDKLGVTVTTVCREGFLFAVAVHKNGISVVQIMDNHDSDDRRTTTLVPLTCIKLPTLKEIEQSNQKKQK